MKLKIHEPKKLNKMNVSKKLLFITAIIFASINVRANNIQITNVSVVRANNSIKFDVSWDNGWRSSTLNNWDAAWVFFKYKESNGRWRPLNLTNTGNNIPSGFSSSIATNAPIIAGIGAFLYRSAVGSGTTIITNVELGILPIYASGVYDIKAFAIEMVYIPAAPFYANDGISTNGYTSAFGEPVNNGITNINDPIGGFLFSLGSTSFPYGYNAFYCMKYELSQGGYRDFLNTLSFSEQQLHTAVAPSSAAGSYALSTTNRSNIRIKASGISPNTPAEYGCDANGNSIYDEVPDGEYIACNFLNWPDHARYLGWAGLRPLTELEYEKAARGIQLPVAGEFAWGNTQIPISASIYVLTNPNQNNEVVSNGTTTPVGNANFTVTYPNAPYSGPLRNGIFATATSNRITSGASFFGVMEMSGNLWERVITTANTNGRNFDGYHGNGELVTGSFATWPGYDAAANYITGTVAATGLIYRGGSWNTGASFLRVSDRAGLLVNDANNVRANDVGARGCRTAQ
jgi:formylglycine-generating enzyme required for sulfatase activity